jgi:hypothetical protein
MSSSKRTVGKDDVIKALRIREGGGSWAQVIEATGFNGATLRPHIAKHLHQVELNRAPVQKGDRVDSPYAFVEPVKLDADSIALARARGMAWYSIADALGVSEAKCRMLGAQSDKMPAESRVYRAKPAAKAEVKPEPKAEAKPKPAPKARARRAAKKAA